MKTTSKSIRRLVAPVLLVLVTPGETLAQAPLFSGPVEAGKLAAPKNREASGLGASPRMEGVLWIHNDSGGEPVLHAIGHDGQLRGSLHLQGIENTDWEDIASFTVDGKAMLLIADTGNNFSSRSPCVLHVISEPDAAQLSPAGVVFAKPDYSIYFVFEDGARDCEAVAVDAHEGAVYLISKRDVPARLYRLPLKPAGEDIPAAARQVGSLPHLPQPVGLKKMVPAPLFGLSGQPTALDFSPDGRRALVLVYGGLLLFERNSGETWADAFAREPLTLPAFKLPQAEAACFTRDGNSIFVCSEKVLPLLRYDRR